MSLVKLHIIFTLFETPWLYHNLINYKLNVNPPLQRVSLFSLLLKNPNSWIVSSLWYQGLKTCGQKIFGAPKQTIFLTPRKKLLQKQSYEREFVFLIIGKQQSLFFTLPVRCIQNLCQQDTFSSFICTCKMLTQKRPLYGYNPIFLPISQSFSKCANRISKLRLLVRQNP